MSFREPQTPGLGGLNEITTTEELFLQNIAGLSYVAGDMLYHNGTNLVRLPIGTATQVLTVNAGATAPEWSASGASGANTALSNLASVAINTTLVSDTDNTDALGTSAIAWSDLFLGSGSVITWNSAPSTPDITLTHSADTLTFAGGTIVLGVASATTVNKLTITAPATGSTLTIIDGKTLTVSKSMSFTAADDTGAYTLPTGTKTLLATDGAGTSLTGIPYSLTGTANQVILSAATGNITFSLPQSIATGSTVQFAAIELSHASQNSLTASSGILSIEGVAIPTISSTDALSNKTLTAPIINASTQTGNQNIAAVPASDHTANGPTTSIFNLGATIAIMDLVYLGSSSKWLLTDADAAATAGGVMLGICLDGGVDTDTTTVALAGSFVRDDTWNWTPGATLYIDTTTPGQIVATQPSGTDDVIRVVGFAVTADVIYFMPSSDYITHV